MKVKGSYVIVTNTMSRASLKPVVESWIEEKKTFGVAAGALVSGAKMLPGYFMFRPVARAQMIERSVDGYTHRYFRSDYFTQDGASRDIVDEGPLRCMEFWQDGKRDMEALKNGGALRIPEQEVS